MAQREGKAAEQVRYICQASEQAFSEWEDMSVLAEDGESEEVLKLALQLKAY